MADSTLLGREIMATGNWNASTGKVNVTQDMLDRIVSNYNELSAQIPGFAVPIKLGHNKRVGEPAYGYATNVSTSDGKLFADFVDMDPQIVDAIGKKRYNSVSVEVWPKLEYAGKVFMDVLSGVALLGAEWPAVKGLKPIYASEFAANGALTLSQEEVEMNFSQEQMDAAVSEAVAAAKVKFVAAEADIMAEFKTKLAIAEAALQAFADEAEKKEIDSIIAAAEVAGQIVPANKPKILDFAETLRKCVKDGDERKAAIQTFAAFIAAMPKKVSFAEEGEGDSDHPERVVDSASELINDLALAKIAASGDTLNYAAALKLVFTEKPELKTAYMQENR